MTEQLHQIMREVVKLGNLAEINEAAFRVVSAQLSRCHFFAESRGWTSHVRDKIETTLSALVELSYSHV